MDSNANEMIKCVSNMIHIGNGVSKYMSEKSRIIFAKCYMLSRIGYGLPLYCGATEETKNKIHTIIMKVSRWARRSYCFRESVDSICRSIKIDRPSEAILKSTAIFAHDLLSKRKPKQILRTVRTPRSRNKARVSLKYKHLSSKFERNVIHQAIKVYNENIPDHMKTLNTKEFRKDIKKIKYIRKA